MIGSIARAVGGVVMGILGATGAGKPNNSPKNSVMEFVMAEGIKDSLSNDDDDEVTSFTNENVAKQIVKSMKFT